MSEIATTSAPSAVLIDGFSTIKPSNVGEAARLYAAVSSAKPLKDMVNIPIDVADILIQDGTVTDDNGTVEDRLVVTLIDTDGNAYGSNSPTVADNLRALVRIMGEPRTGFWGAALTVIPKLQPSGNGRSFLTLVLPETGKSAAK